MPNMRVAAQSVGNRGADVPRWIGGNDSYTKLLLHCNGVSSTVSDSSTQSQTVLPAGGATQKKENKKFGFKSLYLDGDGDYLEVSGNLSDFAFGASDEWAIDFWTNFDAVDQDHYLVSKGDFNSDGYALYWDQSAGNLILHRNGSDLITYSWSPSANTWYHIAVVGDGSNIKIYIDGTSVGSATQVSMG